MEKTVHKEPEAAGQPGPTPAALFGGLVIRVGNYVILLIQGKYFTLSADDAASMANALSENANAIKQQEAATRDLRSRIQDNLRNTK